MFDFVLCLIIAFVMHQHIVFGFDSKFPFDCFDQNLDENLTLPYDLLNYKSTYR